MLYSSSRNDSRTWLREDPEPYASTAQHLDAHGDIGVDTVSPSPPNAFWPPQLARDNEAPYIYPGSGDPSQDLPQDVHGVIDDENDAWLSPQATLSPRVGQTSSPIFNLEGSHSPLSPQTPASDSWDRHITDDGLSCYFVDRANGRVSWLNASEEAPPPYTDSDQSPLSPQSAGLSPLSTLSPFPPIPPQQVTRTLLSTTEFTRSQSYTASGSPSVAGPSVQRHRSASALPSKVTGPPISSPRVGRPLPAVPEYRAPAQGCQFRNSTSSPSSPASSMLPEHRAVDNLYDPVQQALRAFLAFMQVAEADELPNTREVDDYVLNILSSTRALLYVFATPTDGIPSHLYPAGRRDRQFTSHTYPLQAHMQPLYWNVVQALSNLVSSSLTIQYDATLTLQHSHLEDAAAQVDRTVSIFVAEVREFEDHALGNGASETRRLYGTFTSSADKGNTAGEPSIKTLRALDQAALAEVKCAATVVERKLLSLISSSNNAYQKAVRLQVAGQSIIARLSSLVGFIDGIDIMRDIKLCQEDEGYVRTKARLLSRTLLDAVQSLRDDNATLFITTQMSSRAASADSGEFNIIARNLDMLATGIVGNLNLVLTTLDALHALAPMQHSWAQEAAAPFMNPSARDASPVISERPRPSTSSSTESRQGRSFVFDPWGKRPSTASSSGSSRPSTSSVGELRRPSTCPTFPSPLSNSSGIPSAESQDDVIDMASALTRPSLGIRTSLDSDTEDPVSSHSALFPSLPSLDYSDSFSPDQEDPVEVVTPASVSLTQLNQARVPISSTKHVLYSPLHADRSVSAPPFNVQEMNTSPPRGSKLIKMLGNDAPKYYLDKLNADLKPWFLRPDYSSADILADPDGAIRAGTMKALVQRLTCHEHGDPVFVKHFLMTYKSFMTLDELFDHLVERFHIKPPEGLTPFELDQWTKMKQYVVRMRVLNTFKTMLTDDSVLEKEDLYILDRIKSFLSDPEVLSMTIAKQLLSTTEHMLKGGKSPVKKTMPGLISPPSPIVPNSRKNLKLLDIDPLEMARQITLMESTLYRKIRPAECMARTRQQKSDKVDNITTFIQFSNRTINWVIESVLSKSDPKKRAAVIKHFISVAERCRSMQNFSSTVAIVSALNNPAIRRLKRSWELVGSRAFAQFTNCESILNPDRNFQNYWSALKDASPPAIPFFGRYLSTLTFINDGAEDKLSGQMINFRKRQKAAEVIQDIKHWQSRLYNFHAVAIVLAFIESGLNRYISSGDLSDQFWRLSHEREPRE
ncbi:unnamed protein product [Somion occarium]|uniref:Ras GEF n=1 Tax=Somion occarium TaxID=3059160 RepID=A0ABP1EC41_9APHY